MKEDQTGEGHKPETMRQYPKLVALRILRAYKWAVSPLFPPSCRYVPTCSEYAMEAIERYGIVRGSWRGFMRLLRCHPFVHGGYDPVIKQETIGERLTDDRERPATAAHTAI